MALAAPDFLGDDSHTSVGALLRRKMTPAKALLHPHKVPEGVKHIFEVVEGREQRKEFNIYIEGTDKDNAEPLAEKVESDVTPAAIKQASADGEDSSA